jgi:outer membrane protein OmpA-like peptidoglycan-associated protein
MKPYLFLFFATALSYFPVQAQREIITLDNSSFEENPKAGVEPLGWRDCGQQGETPPDIQPYGGFGVTRPAADGNTYLGLVVRDNKTWEGVSQRLTKPLQAGGCYQMSVQLCRSPRYESATKRDQFRTVNFDKGVVLRIWGGKAPCDRAEMLYESTVVEHYEWRTYSIEFKPKGSHQYIVVEAYYKTPTLFHYNGNILVDGLSNISSCQDLAKNDTPKPKTNPIKPKVDPIKVDPKPNPNPNTNTPKEDKFTSTLQAKDLKVGQSFRLDKLYFDMDSSNINKEAERVLAELLVFLKNNPNVSIEIGGHTNGLPPHEYCDRLSTQRAKNVADYLVKNGIPRTRISHRGYGKRKPIADNETLEGRAKNQRVEITITNL